jgi:hypothetical protein
LELPVPGYGTESTYHITYHISYRYAQYAVLCNSKEDTTQQQQQQQQHPPAVIFFIFGFGYMMCHWMLLDYESFCPIFSLAACASLMKMPALSGVMNGCIPHPKFAMYPST